MAFDIKMPNIYNQKESQRQTNMAIFTRHIKGSALNPINGKYRDIPDIH